MLNVISDSSNIVMDSTMNRKKTRSRRGKKCGRTRMARQLQKETENVDDGNFRYNYADIGVDNLTCKIMCGNQDSSQRLRDSKLRQIRPKYSPKAPPNSTQFLMEEHEGFSFNFGDQMFQNVDDQELYANSSAEKDNITNCFKEYTSGLISDAMNNNNREDIYESNFNFSEVNSTMFMMNDFDQMYDSIRAEQLSRLSKTELIDAVKSLENEITLKERRLLNTPNKSLGFTPKKNKPSTTKLELAEILDELNELKLENIRMKHEIEGLQIK